MAYTDEVVQPDWQTHNVFEAVCEDFVAVDEKFDRVADQEDQDDSHEHCCHSSGTLMSFCQPGSLLVGLVNLFYDEDVQDDHHQHRKGPHEYKVAHKIVVKYVGLR